MTTQDVLDRATGNYLIKLKKELRHALLTGKYYTRVVSVSKSGMSREIKIGYIKNNELHKIYHPEILKIAGMSKSGRITGCGMDMMFAVQYNLFMQLCPKLRYQDRMKRYNEM